MATKEVVCEVLYSGQGMCNLIKVIDDNDKLVYLILIDFGADKDSNTVRDNTLPYLVKTIEAHGRIDVLIMSHTDTDHWNLMPDLFDALKKTVKITKAAVPIGDWTNSKADFEEDLKERMLTKEGYTKFGSAYSSIAKGGGVINQWWFKGDVGLSILAASIKKSDVSATARKSTIEPNTASIVVRCNFKGNNVIFTADATWQTLQWINLRMETYKFPGTNLMCTVPHHGSSTTLNRKWEVLQKFVKKANSQCVVASAEMKGRLYHPNGCVVAKMATHLSGDLLADHGLVLYFTKKSDCDKEVLYTELKDAAKKANPKVKLANWYGFTTSKNIFATLATTTTIFPRWQFTLKSDGKTSVDWNTFTATAVAATPPRTIPEPTSFVVGDTLPPLPADIARHAEPVTARDASDLEAVQA